MHIVVRRQLPSLAEVAVHLWLRLTLPTLTTACMQQTEFQIVKRGPLFV